MAARLKEGPSRVLLIDEDESIHDLVSKYLQHHGHVVDVLDELKELDSALQSPHDVILLDIHANANKGVEMLDRIVRERPELCVVMLTEAAQVEEVVGAMKHGAFDFLEKPLDFQRLSIAIRNATEHTRLRQATTGLKATLIRDDGGPALVCASQAMSEVISLVERVAGTRVPVLIHGESGSGKEVVARRVHARSKRRDGPFVAINCTALPADALEEELFGHNDDAGKLAEAAGGSLFLDEVGELGMELQTRLLRVLQENDKMSTRSELGAARIIAATSKHLPSEVSRGQFRADLYYRLNVFSINVPPLRDRIDDIPALARYGLAQFAAREAKPPPQLGGETIDVMKHYEWPGNVRELNNVIERAALLCGGGVVQPADLPTEVRESAKASEGVPRRLPHVGNNTEPPAHAQDISLSKVRPLQELEREMMVAALQETQGNVSEAARRLGIGRATFYRRAQRYGLTRDDGFPG